MLRVASIVVVHALLACGPGVASRPPEATSESDAPELSSEPAPPAPLLRPRFEPRLELVSGDRCVVGEPHTLADLELSEWWSSRQRAVKVFAEATPEGGLVVWQTARRAVRVRAVDSSGRAAGSAHEIPVPKSILVRGIARVRSGWAMVAGWLVDSTEWHWAVFPLDAEGRPLASPALIPLHDHVHLDGVSEGSGNWFVLHAGPRTPREHTRAQFLRVRIGPDHRVHFESHDVELPMPRGLRHSADLFVGRSWAATHRGEHLIVDGRSVPVSGDAPPPAPAAPPVGGDASVMVDGDGLRIAWHVDDGYRFGRLSLTGERTVEPDVIEALPPDHVAQGLWGWELTSPGVLSIYRAVEGVTQPTLRLEGLAQQEAALAWAGQGYLFAHVANVTEGLQLRSVHIDCRATRR